MITDESTDSYSLFLNIKFNVSPIIPPWECTISQKQSFKKGFKRNVLVKEGVAGYVQHAAC